MSTQIHPGCESFSAQGTRQGVLVLHGYGGSPESVMSVAKMCAAAGYTVECPRLPGHGTSIEDMLNYGFSDWVKTYTDTLNDLKSRCDEVIVFGLSFGGLMTAYLAQRNPDVKAVVFVNPWIIPHDASLVELAKGAVEGGVFTMESMVTDPRVPNGIEFGYAETNIKGFVEISELLPTVLDVSKIKVPALLFSSREDYTLPVANGDALVANYGGSIERIWMENSSHVATMDVDKDLIETKTLEFLKKVFA